MSLFEKLKTATENKDVQSYIDLMDDDCVFVRHQSGTEMNKAQIADMLTKMMASDQTDMGQRRCIRGAWALTSASTYSTPHSEHSLIRRSSTKMTIFWSRIR